MTSPHRPGLHLERDRISGRGAIALAVLFVAITVGGSWWAWRIEAAEVARLTTPFTANRTPSRPQESRDRRSVGRMNLTAIGQDSTAQMLQRTQRQALESGGWMDQARGLVRLSIDDAMAEAAARTGGATAVEDSAVVRSDTAARTGTLPADSTVVPLEASLLPWLPTQEVGGSLAGARLTERQGHAVPLEAQLVDQDNRHVRLGGAFDGGTPVLLVPGYYRCTMLCGLVLDRVAAAVREADAELGQDYRIVAFSIDPRDSPATAAQRRARLGTTASTDAWRFLVGDSSVVGEIADAIGFGYRYDPDTDQYAHTAVVVALTPDGRVSRYIDGLDIDGGDIDAAISAAASGDTGSRLKQALLRCFHYTPAARRWAGLVANTLRGGAVVILLGLGAVIGLALRRSRVGAS